MIGENEAKFDEKFCICSIFFILDFRYLLIYFGPFGAISRISFPTRYQGAICL